MYALLTRLGLPQAIGVYVDERSIHLSRTLTTPVGTFEIARINETANAESCGETIDRLLTSAVGHGRFSRIPVTIGLSLERTYFISRPIQSARDDIAPLVLLREALRSSQVSIDDMLADVVKAVPDKRPVATIVSCEKKFLVDIVERLHASGIRLARVEPAISALLRAAAKQHRNRRNANVVIRYFLHDNKGLAVLTVKGLPIVCRQFTMCRGDEATAIVSTGRSLLTIGTHCGIESSLDAVMIHGRDDLQRLLDVGEMRVQLGTDINWLAGPSLDNGEIASSLAFGCTGENDSTFDLARTLKRKTTLWELFPVREALLQAALLLLMAWFLIYRTQCVNHDCAELARENIQTIDPSRTQAELEEQRNNLQQQVSGVRSFLKNRLIWTAFERELAAGLPDNVYLTSFQGSSALASNGKRRSGNSSLVLRGAVSIPQTGLIPHEIDRLLNTLRDNTMLQRAFPVVELAALKRLNNASNNTSTAMFTVVCLPKGAKRQ